MDILTILIRFIMVFLFSLVFGLEHQRSHKPIGFGPFIFVAIGSCGLAITALLIKPDDPLPLLGAIVTGIGFLGAGALIKTTDKIFGATTAASIWIFAIMGLLIGIGKYLIGSIIYILIWIVILIDKILESRGIGSYQKKLHITSRKNIHSGELTSILNTKKYKIINIDIDIKSNKYSLSLLVEGTRENINQIPKKLFQIKEIESFKIE